MKTLAWMREHEDADVCQHFFPRKGGFCGATAEFVVGSRGACAEHLGNLVLDTLSVKGWDEDSVMVFQHHVWEEQVRLHGPDLSYFIEWHESNIKRVRS